MKKRNQNSYTGGGGRKNGPRVRLDNATPTKAARRNPFQIKVNRKNSLLLHERLVTKLPNVSLFSPAWFLFVFEHYWYDDVEKRLVEIDGRVANETRTLCPPAHRIWRWAELIPDPMDVRVVIVGQDPHTRVTADGTPMADGLAFSVSREYYSRVKTLPPSLVNVLNAVRKVPVFRGDGVNEALKSEVLEGDLQHWSRQGVLLLNDVLTAPGTSGCANSHRDFGWNYVTDAVVRRLGEHRMPHRVFFMLWGRFAQESKEHLISCTDRGRGGVKHRVFKSHHPSPLAVNRMGEFDYEQFALCNKLLEKDGLQPVQWV
ncbi:uracil-DNA glycosylase-like [Homalodisca vitripennis]|uniref:uracil-DNA glycosylase-like n=1 Tax=Homalodisca vitripennis TaxID=197043 RepID=UPI001EEA2D4B|nr:uracil-DNA glycosylase-like [Homalodisca vitripennis]KAG8314024.1 hypothetical protein J6590_102013 [Homalodisca vitripennis]